MNDTNRKNTDKASTKKRSFIKPVLRKHGRLHQLTLTLGQSGADADTMANAMRI